MRLAGRIRTCGQNKLNAHLYGEERVDVGFEEQWIYNSSMADRDPTLTVDKNGHRHFSNGMDQQEADDKHHHAG
ncbi:hypothetical protein [Granulicella sp. S156]|jgi:hypothetical protein|uniref:hypothetical protein n=1 Tax=Granulicella sp. S156 TaxID=1747224 RepID=UPI001575779E|nr:hypothetical protein [Granulicella sp. S156]